MYFPRFHTKRAREGTASLLEWGRIWRAEKRRSRPPSPRAHTKGILPHKLLAETNRKVGNESESFDKPL